MADNLKKLQDLITLVTESISRSDFEKAFSALVDFIKKVEVNLTEKIDGKTQTAVDEMTVLKEKYLGAVQEVKDEAQRLIEENKSTIPTIKKWAIERISDLFLKSNVSSALTEKLQAFDTKITEAEKKIEEIQEYTFPDSTSIALEASKQAQEALKPLIPTLPKLEAELPLLGVPIRDGLEALEDDERLSISAIRDLQEQLDELKKRVGSHVMGGGVNLSAITIHTIDSESPTEVPNGVITTFTLGHTPSPASSLKVYLNGARQLLGASNDYTLSGTTLTFNTAPPTNSNILFDYMI